MSNTMAAVQHYARHGAQTSDPRDLEYDVILGVTRNLREAIDGASSSYPAFVKALRDNERLWIEIGTQVAAPDNKLPKNLRARLFYIAEFVGKHTASVLSEGTSAQSLIDMNVALLRGLKARA